MPKRLPPANNPICTIENCVSRQSAKGLCVKHYQLQYNKKYVKTENYRRIVTSPRARLQTARSHALKRGITWDITLEEFITIILSPCFYCGIHFTGYGSGLDRLDPKGPYKLNNVVICCGDCNFVKGSRLSMAEMILLIEVLRKTRGEKIWNLKSS